MGDQAVVCFLTANQSAKPLLCAFLFCRGRAAVLESPGLPSVPNGERLLLFSLVTLSALIGFYLTLRTSKHTQTHTNCTLQGDIEFLVAETPDGKLDLQDCFIFDGGECDGLCVHVMVSHQCI